MRYSELKVEANIVNKTLADICDMIDQIENVACGCWKPGDRAMWRMLCELEDKTKVKYRALNTRIARF